MSPARDREDRRRILTIVGPTAVGKTSVAIAVTGKLGGEIVSADSRQIYRGMDVGTAKPTASERAAVPHHMTDLVEAAEIYDAARFAEDAEEVIGRLIASGIEPVVAGGTGFYLSSLFEGLFEGPRRNDDVREALKARLTNEGATALHRELAELDPASAERIHPNDSARIVRALEVRLSTGRTLSDWHSTEMRTPEYAAAYFGLRMDREKLYARIDRRVDAMMESGLLEEVRGLLESGRLREGMPAASAVGYRELLPVARGGGDVASAVTEIKRNTRRYAKRQMTWFSSREGIRWLDVDALGVRGAAEAILAAWSEAHGEA